MKSKNKQFFVNSKFSVLHTNIQASKYRKNSLEAIVKALDIDLVTVNETNLRKDDKFSLDGYKTFSKNRQNAPMGGIATSIVNKFATDVLKTAEGKSEEFLVIRLGQFDPALNVINLYGAQETRLTVEPIKDNWENILEEIVKIESRGENLLLIGDTNRHIEVIVPGDCNKTSAGGKLLVDFLAKVNYVLVNAQEDVT